MLPRLADPTRDAIAAVARPGHAEEGVRDVVRAAGGNSGGVESIRRLAEESWRDPWMGGELGESSPYDPVPPADARRP